MSDLRSQVRGHLDVARAAADARWGRPRDAYRPVYLVAPAGHPNHGDEQLVAGWLRYLRHRLPGTPVVVDCHTPGQAAVLHHAEHPDVLFTDTLWRLAGECTEAAEAIGFCRRAVADQGIRPAVASGIELLLDASTVHLIGGGYVNDQWPHHLGVVAAAGEMGRLSGALVVATGQGFVPCAVPAALADALRGFDLVTVRDAGSHDLLATTDVPVRRVGDDGWLALSDTGQPAPTLRRSAPPEGGPAQPAAPPVYRDDPDTSRDLVICVQSDLGDPDALADVLARVLADWAVPGERMTVVESIPGSDRVVWDRVCARAAGATADGALGDRSPSAGDRDGDDDDEVGAALSALGLPRARFVSFRELWAEGLPARSGQTWVTTRFHAHLFAAARGASGVAVRVGSEYYDVKHGSLTEAGSAWPALGTGAPEIPPRPTGGGFDPAVVAALVSSAEELAAEIYPGR